MLLSKRFLLLIALTCSVSGVVGCRVEYEGTGPGKRHQVLALEPSEEVQIGRQAFQESLRGVRSVQSGPQVDQIRRVSQRIAKAIQIESLQREINLHVKEGQFEWEYALVEDRRVNAFCLPGGKVVVFSGLMQFVENDDQLATVLSHEIAHALAHHASERIARTQMRSNPLSNLAFNREQESEADHIGIFLMTFAGYDPDQAVEMWRQMLLSRGQGLPLPEFLSDHPNDARRLQNMDEWASHAKAGKAAFDAGHIAKP